MLLRTSVGVSMLHKCQCTVSVQVFNWDQQFPGNVSSTSMSWWLSPDVTPSGRISHMAEQASPKVSSLSENLSLLTFSRLSSLVPQGTVAPASRGGARMTVQHKTRSPRRFTSMSPFPGANRRPTSKMTITGIVTPSRV